MKKIFLFIIFVVSVLSLSSCAAFEVIDRPYGYGYYYTPVYDCPPPPPVHHHHHHRW